MPASFPCPNPVCTHLFTPQAMHGVSTLVCPQCGHSFALQAAPPAPVAPRPKTPSKAIPVAQPIQQAPATPVARPVVVQPRPAPPPIAVPVVPPAHAADDSELEFDTPKGATVSLRRGRTARPPRPWVAPVVVGLVTILVGSGIAALFVFRERYAPPDIDAPDTTFIEYNFSLTAPKAPWKQDKELQGEWMLPPPGGILLWTRSDPASTMAIYYRDYPQRIPPVSELLDMFLSKMHKQFDNLIWQPRPPAELGFLEPNYKLAGQPALIVEFQGDFDEVPYYGECVILAHRGYVYWVATWAPEAQKAQAAADWDQFRAKFQTLNKREGWMPRPRQTREIKGNGYTLACATDLWRDVGLEAPEPAVKAQFNGFDYTRPGAKFNAGEATLLQILETEKEDDLEKATKKATDGLRKHLEDQQLGQLNLQEVETRDVEVSGVKGQLKRLRVKTEGSKYDRFLLLGVFPLENQVVVLRAEALWARRDLWETELLEVVSSLKVK